MSTINLAVEKGSGSNYPRFFTSGLIGSLIALLLATCLYGGLLYMNKKLNMNIEDVHAQYMEEYGKFLAGNANDVADFDNRNAVASKLINQTEPTNTIFKQLESSILPMVHLTSLVYDRDSRVVTLNCSTDGFNSEAKQVLSFKENEAVASMVLSKSLVNTTNGKLDFAVSLKMK